jgi:PAS domain S-box-containing protein
MDTIVRLTGAERGFLMLHDETGQMTTRIARNWEQESLNASEFAISRTIIQKVIDSGTAVITTNAQEDPRFGGHESIVAYNLRSILCVPLKVKNELIGVIYADNRMRSGIFNDAERDLLVAFSNQAAVALENARLFASLRRTLEEVTELKNLMDNIFASITSGVITADVRDQITLSNRAAEAIIGQTTAEMLGKRLDEVLPAVAGEINPRVAAVRATDHPVTDLELSLESPRGRQDWRSVATHDATCHPGWLLCSTISTSAIVWRLSASGPSAWSRRRSSPRSTRTAWRWAGVAWTSPCFSPTFADSPVSPSNSPRLKSWWRC